MHALEKYEICVHSCSIEIRNTLYAVENKYVPEIHLAKITLDFDIYRQELNAKLSLSLFKVSPDKSERYGTRFDSSV